MRATAAEIEARPCAVTEASKEEGVLISPWHASRVRAVTHLDVDTSAISRAAEVVRGAIERSAAR